MYILGITGGIATGKSTVTRLLGEFGARTASADADARVVVAPGSPALASVFTAFPEARSGDGTLDRAALARRIFADDDARKRLESITHPAIIARMRAVIDAARRDPSPGVLAYEVPLLYEAGLESLFDSVLVVTCSAGEQAARIQQREADAGRPPLGADALADRLAAQMPVEEKARRADHVIRTDSSLEETRGQAKALWAELTAG